MTLKVGESETMTSILICNGESHQKIVITSSYNPPSPESIAPDHMNNLQSKPNIITPIKSSAQ